MKPILVVQGATRIDDVPGLAGLQDEAEIRLASSTAGLRAALPGAEVMLGWNFRAANLRQCWAAADSLRWVHWAGAGVDAALFPEMRASEVVLTNARGVFDRAMAEWTLGMIVAFAKDLTRTLALQARAEWKHRLSEMVTGKAVLVVGVGAIGREVGRLLRALGMRVEGVGRSARDDDADFGRVHAIDDLRGLLPTADYVVLITPLTEATRGLFGAAEFAAMAPHARLINIGRGALVDEVALLAALEAGQIGGAALDVFVEEPLPSDHPLWKAPNCIVSPHMSGDFAGFEAVMAEQFLANWARYRRGETLLNPVDKDLGFARAGG